MNKNAVITDGWSNPESKALFEQQWPEQPELYEQYVNGGQCGGCSFFAPFNADWGLCCNKSSRHFRETVFEHFTCAHLVDEGWGPHSFRDDPDFLRKLGLEK